MSLYQWNSFPYAYNYLKKHQYSWEELDALYRLTNLFSIDTIINPSIAKGTLRGPAVGAGLGGPDGVNVKVYYWEVSIHRTKSRERQPEFVTSVGFERHDSFPSLCHMGITCDSSDKHRVLYRSDGSIIGQDASDEVLYYEGRESSGPSVGTETFGSGDVIGCGINNVGWREIFFTKNGRQIVAVRSRNLLFKLCRPCLVTEERSTTFSLNHGDAPFKFNIGVFCSIRPSRLTEGLPQELFQIVIQHYLSNLNVSSFKDIKAIYRLSTVSRHCYKMCHKLVQKTVSLDSHRNMSAARHLGRLSLTQELITVENARSPWLHILFSQSHPHSAASALVQDWICDYNNHEFRSPMDLDTFARSHRYDSLSKLEIRRRRFKNWTKFAKLVFSLPQLEHLVISGVDWDSSPKVPPPWLRFHGRLRSFRCSDIAGPHLWLFIAGQPPTGKEFWGPALFADEISVSAQIVEAAINDCALRLPVNRLDFEHQADAASYRLTGFGRTTSKKAIEFTLVPVDEYYHRLSNIWVRDASPSLLAEIVSLSSGLPGFETPDIEKATLEIPRRPPVSSDFSTSTPDEDSSTGCSSSKVLSPVLPFEDNPYYERHTSDLGPTRPFKFLLVEAKIRSEMERIQRLLDHKLEDSCLVWPPFLPQKLDLLLQEEQALASQLLDELAKALPDAKARVYIKPPPESWGIPVQKRKILQWDTQNKRGIERHTTQHRKDRRERGASPTKKKRTQSRIDE